MPSDRFYLPYGHIFLYGVRGAALYQAPQETYPSNVSRRTLSGPRGGLVCCGAGSSSVISNHILTRLRARTRTGPVHSFLWRAPGIPNKEMTGWQFRQHKILTKKQASIYPSGPPDGAVPCCQKGSPHPCHLLPPIGNGKLI